MKTLSSEVQNPAKIILVSSIGTLIEWAEYAFYGYMAVQMAKLFFPHEDPRIGMLSALGVFAAGFIMRPLGAIVLGHIADKNGRKKALLYSMILMGLATFGIGILPTYQSIGLLAPLLLLICRLLQGFAVSSEALGAAVFLIEHDNKNPILAGSWPGLAAALGATFGGLAAIWVAHSELNWAWRVPFIAGAVSCFIGLYLRQKIAESPLFLEIYTHKKIIKMPLFSLLKGYGSSLLKCAVMGILVATIVYVCNLYYSTYLITISKMPQGNALIVTTIGELLVVLFFPLGALFAARWGVQYAIRLGLILFIFFAPGIFMLAKTGNFYLALTGQFIYAVLDALITAPMFKWLYDLFPTNIRVTGITVSWNVAVALLGGTSPLIVQHLVNAWNWDTAPGFYISVCSLIVLLCTYLKPITRQYASPEFANSMINQ